MLALILDHEKGFYRTLRTLLLRTYVSGDVFIGNIPAAVGFGVVRDAVSAVCVVDRVHVVSSSWRSLSGDWCAAVTPRHNDGQLIIDAWRNGQLPSWWRVNWFQTPVVTPAVPAPERLRRPSDHAQLLIQDPTMTATTTTTTKMMVTTKTNHDEKEDGDNGDNIVV